MYGSHYEHRVHAETVRADVIQIQMPWPSLPPYVGQLQFQALPKYGYSWVAAQPPPQPLPSPLKPLETQTHGRRVAGTLWGSVAGTLWGNYQVRTLVR